MQVIILLFGILQILFGINDQELWLKIPNNSNTSFLDCWAKLVRAAKADDTYTSGQDDLTIATGQSWTTSAPSGTNQVTTQWASSNFKNAYVETGGLYINGTQVTSTAAELNYSDGVTSNIQTQLNAKASLSGASFTGDVTLDSTNSSAYDVTWDSSEGHLIFNDSAKAYFGTDKDMQITSTHVFSRVMAESLILQLAQTKEDGDVWIQSDDGSGGLATYIAADGGTGEAQLYHYGTEKLATKSTGVDITGNITLTSTDAGATAEPTLTLYRNSSSPADSDELGSINFKGRNENSEDIQYAEIISEIKDASDGTEDGSITLKVIQGGTLANRITLNGNSNTVFANRDVLLGTGVDLIFEGATGDANETTLTVTDPTADRTITLPNASGTVLTSGNADLGATTTSSSDVDHVLINDGGVLKKITVANLGTATVDDATALAIALG